jgi:hypothetical protein
MDSVDIGCAQQMVERAVALCGNPYATAATALVVLLGAISVVLMGACLVYETYVHSPAHLRKRQQEKRRARVNSDSAFGVGFKSCPEVCSLPLYFSYFLISLFIFIYIFLYIYIYIYE